MKEGYWVIRTYESGNRVGEKTKFWIPGQRSNTVKGRRHEKAEIKKQEQNEYSAVKSLARLLNANCMAGDLALGLDYSEDGMDRLLAWCKKQGQDLESMCEAERMDAIYEAAAHQLTLCIRRVKRELDKEGVELKCCAAITSDMDGNTGLPVRVHHHLVVNKESRDAFLKKWSELGGVDWEYIREQDDYTPIAEYFIRQVRRIPNAKKYITTRNLIRPQPKDRVAQTDAELRVPNGAKILYRGEYKKNCPQYIRYTLPLKHRRGRTALPETEVDTE